MVVEHYHQKIVRGVRRKSHRGQVDSRGPHRAISEDRQHMAVSMRGYKRRTSNRQGLIRVTSGDQCVERVRRRVECEYRSLVFVLVTALGSDQDLSSRAWREPEREHGPG